MKIVAFLQNPWFKEGTDPAIANRYVTDQVFHRKILARTMSGHRLLTAFGQEDFNSIWWDNVAPLAADYASGITPPDPKHIDRVLSSQAPELILTFGLLAKDAINRSPGSVRKKVMHCHHPNARFHTQSELNDFAQEVRDWVMCQERGEG